MTDRSGSSDKKFAAYPETLSDAAYSGPLMTAVSAGIENPPLVKLSCKTIRPLQSTPFCTTSTPFKSQSKQASDPWHLLNVFSIADKYGVTGLKRESKNGFISWLLRVKSLGFARTPGLVRSFCTRAAHILAIEQPEMEEVRRVYLDLLIAQICHVNTCSDFQALLQSSPAFRSDLDRAVDGRLAAYKEMLEMLEAAEDSED